MTRRYRYVVRATMDRPELMITIRARSDVEASRIAANLGFSFHILLIGPI